MVFIIIIILLLFFIFLALFGYPAYKRYESEGVMVEETDENVSDITPPAVTLCPRNPENDFKLGWKENLGLTSPNFVKDGPCKDREDAIELKECIQNLVFEKEEMIVTKNEKMCNITQWEEYFSLLLLGKCSMTLTIL